MAERVEGNGSGRTYRGAPAEQPIDLRRHLDALKRGRWLIAFFVLTVTGTAIAVSLLLPKTYRATATIVFEGASGIFESRSPDSVERDLETIEALITTNDVLEEAGEEAGESLSAMREKVRSSVDRNANIISIVATDDDPEGAAAIANAVAGEFLDERRLAEQRRLDVARSNLLDELNRLRGQPDSDVEIEAIRQRLSELSVSEASVGEELRLAQAAEAPTRSATPRPIRNSILAFFASLFLGVLIALARDQLRPRVAGPRELSRLTDLPVLVGIPYVRRRFRRRPALVSSAEYEAYQTLQASIRFQLPPDRQHVILVTSALEGEGKTTVTANLGRALARAGQKTLLISGDLRRPRLHTLFDIEVAPGLAELLTAAERTRKPPGANAIKAMVKQPPGARTNLDVLPSGAHPADPARLLLSDAFRLFLDELRQMDYAYVLVDGPPVLGIADSQVVASQVDDVLVVARLDRLSFENVVEMRDLLDRRDLTPLGLVTVGIRRGASYYYYAGTPVLDEA